jgi:glycosyltransferase involved in cell wall biosynthesis
VICYNLPAFKEVFNCEAVRLCKEGDIDEMISEATNLLNNVVELKRLQSVGRHFVRQFDWGAVAKREAQIYNLILTNSKK